MATPFQVPSGSNIIQENNDAPNAVPLDLESPPDDMAVSLPAPGEGDSRPPTPEVAQQRAVKTAIGLGDTLRKNDAQIYEDYITGQENMIRKQAATQLDFDKTINNQKTLTDMAARKGSQLTYEEFMKVMDPFSPANKPADVSTVVEKAFSDKMLSTLNTAVGYMDDNFMGVARAQGVPVDDTLTEGSELLTKNQYIQTRMQNTEQNLVQQQSWPGYLADQAKQMFQPYTEYKERGLIPDTGVLTGIGLGSNLDAQHATLYRLPMEDFKKNFDKAMDYLEANNPSMAVAYAKALLGQDTFDTALGNTFSALMIPDYVGLGKVAGKVGASVRQYNRVRKATADIVSAAAKNPNADAITASEGVGDIAEAAVQKVTNNINDAMAGRGDPLHRAEETLLSTWQDDAKKFAANPGTYLSRELVTRIQDGFVRDGTELFETLGTMNRVERTPVAVTSPDVIRAKKDQIRADYKGPANTLLDVEGPIREPTSNTYWYKSKIGNYDATLFADEETAQGFAKQLGISEPVIAGSAPERVYLSEAAAKSLESVKSTPTGTRFYTDGGIEVIPKTDPESGSIPFNLKTQKFEDKLTPETTVKQQGLGFYIEHWVPMKETDNITRDMMIHTSSGEPIKDAISTSSSSGVNSIKNSLLGWVRNSDDTLSVNEAAQRKAVTYSQANIHKWAQGLYKDIEDIASGRVREDPITGEPLSPLKVYPKSWFGKLSNRKVAKQFEDTLAFAQKNFDPETGEPGYFFKSPGELQDHYQRNYQRDPSYLETKSYFNFSKLIEGDRMMREVSEFRNRARIGVEQHSLSAFDVNTGERVNSDFFDGIKHNTFPGGDAYILIMSKNKGEETLHKLGSINTTHVEALREAVKTGKGKVIELYDRDHQPLANFSDVAKDKLISYVYTESSEAKPMDFNHVKRRGGGHFEWDYDFYLKQADVRAQTSGGINDKRPGVEHLYVGDKTVMPIKNRKLGQNVAKLWNEAHEYIKNNEWDKVKPIAQKLGIKYQEFTGWYKPGRDADGRVIPPMLNPHEPLVVVNKNKKISEMGTDLQDRYLRPRPGGEGYYNTFRDATKEGPANNFKVAYNQERNSSFDFRTINDVGSRGNPVYAHQPADLIDPLTTMNRALNRVINSTFMDDYKLYGVEHWLREAEPYLNAGENSKNVIRSSPFKWFNDPKYHAGVDKDKIWNLESNRYKIQQFTGLPNKFDTWIHTLTNQLADNFYEKYGPEANRSLVGKTMTVLPLSVLHHVTDPVSWMRSVTFNFKLGLFAIPQFLVQAQTHSLIWALEPRHGTVGTYQMMLHNWSKFTDNPRILDSLDNYATKMNIFGSKVRPGEFLEARRELENSGFETVAGEYSNLNTHLKTNFIQNDFQKGLSLGQYPFRMGEQSTRVTAWYTAFREFRDANPTTPITNIERSKILNKADLLTVNMSRASSSMLNEGIFSLSTQFLTYQMKLAELFLGKRLGEDLTQRNLARARILTVFTALYGLPNALGVTGAPFSDNIREHFMDSLGYIPGEKWLSTMVNEGLPAWSISMITGRLPNVGDRFGSQGFQNIKQGLRGDIPMTQAIGGASVSVVGNFLGGALDPFSQYIQSRMRGDGQYKIKSADLVEPLKEISSYSMAAKWLAAINTGKWISKNEQYVTDVTPLYATMLSLTGMSPQEQDDMFNQNTMVKGEVEAKKRVLKEFIKDWRRGIEAKEAGDNEQGNAYHTNAFSRAAVVGMSNDEISTAIAIGNRGYERAIDNSDINVWKQGDVNRLEDRLEQYKRKLKMRDEGKR